MSKLKKHIDETLNNPSNSPEGMSKKVEGTFEDILFQLEAISEIKALNFNIKKKLVSNISSLRKIGQEVAKDLKSGR